MEVHEYDEELQNLAKDRKGMIKEVDRLTSKRTTTTKTLEEFRRARKTKGGSIYTRIDNILSSMGLYEPHIMVAIWRISTL